MWTHLGGLIDASTFTHTYQSDQGCAFGGGGGVAPLPPFMTLSPASRF